MKILIFSDKASFYPELAAGAAALGEVSAYTVDSAEKAAQIPAAAVYYTAPAEGNMFEDYLPTLKEIVAQEKPNAVFIGATKRGKYMAARLAAALGTAALTDLSGITAEKGQIRGKQLYYSGVGVSSVASKGSVAVVTITAGSYDPAAGNAAVCEEFPFTAVESGIKCKEIKPKQGETVNLAAAKKVIGVGRGFSSKESLAMAEDLAKAVGGEVGCSRPIAEGEGWMGTDRYIGVSGVMLKPDIYFAVGISGQVQHTIGITGAKTIIAINKDKSAPIFKICDYGIVGDLNKILPALTAMIKTT